MNTPCRYELVKKAFLFSCFTGLRYSDMKEWMEAAGITKHITYHCSRHTAATMLLTLGASIYVVSKILGHKSIKMTEIYAKIVDKKKLETVNLVNGMFDQIPAIQ